MLKISGVKGKPMYHFLVFSILYSISFFLSQVLISRSSHFSLSTRVPIPASKTHLLIISSSHSLTLGGQVKVDVKRKNYQLFSTSSSSVAAAINGEKGRYMLSVAHNTTHCLLTHNVKSIGFQEIKIIF